MQVIKEGKMPNGTEIQIEDWSENYNSMPPSSTIVAYAVSKTTKEGAFSPKAGEVYRFSFNFDNENDAAEAFVALVNGRKDLADYRHIIAHCKYADCL